MVTYVVRVTQLDNKTGNKEIKTYIIEGKVFNSVKELDKHMREAVEFHDKTLIGYEIRVDNSIKYRERLKEQKDKYIDVVTIDKVYVKDIIKDVIIKNNGNLIKSTNEILGKLSNIISIDLSELEKEVNK